MATAPRADSPTPTEVKVEPTPTVSEPPLAAPQAIAAEIERQPAEPPDPAKPATDVLPQEPASAKTASISPAASASRPEPTDQIVEVKHEPPPRTTAEAKPRVTEAPIESAATAASQADAGVEYDELPSPHATNRQPPYPADAYARRQQGTVVLHLQVTGDGTVGEIRVAQSSGIASLDDAAVAAARAWRYTPARRDGRNIDMVFETRVNFSIRG